MQFVFRSGAGELHNIIYGGMVYAKDDAPQPSDRAAVWVGMYLCKSFLRWVVCDLAHNLTEFAWSGEFGRAFPADVQKWLVYEGEGEGGERLRDGYVMWRTRWSATRG